MRPRDSERVLEKWRRWLRKIRGDITATLWRRYVYQELAAIVGSNPRIQKRSTFYKFLMVIYADSISIAIRRQVKARRDSISLASLLRDIAEKPAVLSLESCVGSITQDMLRQQAEKDIGYLFTVREPRHIRKRLVMNDLHRLKELALKVEDHVDTRVAHIDPKPPDIVPTYDELTECVNYMEKAVLTYEYLLESTSGPGLFLPPDRSWKDIFKEPWIAKGDHQHEQHEQCR